MPEITFDSTDNPEQAAAQQSAEAKSLAQGERIMAEEEAITSRQYEKAREDADAETRYAGKFKSAEDLEKAYKELEKKLGQKDEVSDEAEGDQEGTEEGDGQEVEEAD
jgi:hypothetical protein